MLFASLRFKCRFSSHACLQENKYSMLRGAFGRNLRRIVCVLARRQDCVDCLLAASCIYIALFEPDKMPAADKGPQRGIHPYVLVPPLETQREYDPGADFGMEMTLFGSGLKHLPHIVYTVLRMGEEGLASRRDGPPGVFALDSVWQQGRKIYDGDAGTMAAAEPEALDLAPCTAGDIHRLDLNFVTPLRVKFQNSYAVRPHFHILIRAALRRIAELEKAFGRGEPNLDYGGLVHRAAAVREDLSKSRWQDIDRYSCRQQTAMKMGGIVGTAAYEGELAEFLPLLRYCEVAHLGKQSSFGYGRICLDSVTP